MTPIRFAFALVLPLGLALPALPAMAQNVTVTTGNGGTIDKSRDCIRGNGAANCETSTTATTAGGQSATKNRLRTTEAGASTTTVTGSGPGGDSKSRTRKLTFSN